MECPQGSRSAESSLACLAAAESAAVRLLFTALAPGICDAPRMLSFSLRVRSRLISPSSFAQAVNPTTTAESVNAVLRNDKNSSSQLGVFTLALPVDRPRPEPPVSRPFLA